MRKENADFPAQFKQVEDHQILTEQELRRRELELQEKEKELYEIERKKAMEDSKKRRGKNVNMADVNQPNQKKKRGLFNKGKRSGRETVSSRQETGGSSLPKSDGIDLQLLPDDHFDN